MSGCNIEQCIPCLWTVPCPFSLRGDRGRRFRNDAFAGSLVWNFTGFFRLCYECIVLLPGLEINGKRVFRIFHWLLLQVFLFLIESMSSFLIFGHSLHRCRCLPLYWVQFLSVWEAGLCVRIGGAPGGDDAWQ